MAKKTPETTKEAAPAPKVVTYGMQKRGSNYAALRVESQGDKVLSVTVLGSPGSRRAAEAKLVSALADWLPE